jgi:hypothetical protein
LEYIDDLVADRPAHSISEWAIKKEPEKD